MKFSIIFHQFYLNYIDIDFLRKCVLYCVFFFMANANAWTLVKIAKNVFVTINRYKDLPE